MIPNQKRILRFNNLYTGLENGTISNINRCLEPNEKYHFIKYLLGENIIVLHGTNINVNQLLPNSEKENGTFLFAIDNLVAAVCNSMRKILFHDFGYIHNDMIRGGEYQVSNGDKITQSYSYVSVNKEISSISIPPAIVYLCSKRSFIIAKNDKPGRLNRVSGGLVKTGTNWVSGKPVKPLAKLNFHFKDFPCGAAWHTTEETILSTMVNFKQRRVK
ncbi:MAG: hypothetical protein JEZ06_19010 [Anaerolineaceae bacterium]|nr:hypothetical protein [Anaerolineaceae bacterium]